MYFNFCASYIQNPYHLSIVFTILLFQNDLDINIIEGANFYMENHFIYNYTIFYFPKRQRRRGNRIRCFEERLKRKRRSNYKSKMKNFDEKLDTKTTLFFHSSYQTLNIDKFKIFVQNLFRRVRHIFPPPCLEETEKEGNQDRAV